MLYVKVLGRDMDWRLPPSDRKNWMVLVAENIEEEGEEKKERSINLFNLIQLYLSLQFLYLFKWPIISDMY